MSDRIENSAKYMEWATLIATRINGMDESVLQHFVHSTPRTRRPPPPESPNISVVYYPEIEELIAQFAKMKLE